MTVGGKRATFIRDLSHSFRRATVVARPLCSELTAVGQRLLLHPAGSKEPGKKSDCKPSTSGDRLAGKNLRVGRDAIPPRHFRSQGGYQS